MFKIVSYFLLINSIIVIKYSFISFGYSDWIFYILVVISLVLGGSECNTHILYHHLGSSDFDKNFNYVENYIFNTVSFLFIHLFHKYIFSIYFPRNVLGSRVLKILNSFSIHISCFQWRRKIWDNLFIKYKMLMLDYARWHWNIHQGV